MGMYRLDRDGEGWQQHQEGCLADITGAYLGTDVVYTLGAYNQALSVQSDSGEEAHLVGFLARIQCTSPKSQYCAEWGSPGQGGSGSAYYAGAVFFIRRGRGDYRLNEVS